MPKDSEPVIRLNKGVPKMGTPEFAEYVKEQHLKANDPRFKLTEKGKDALKKSK